MVRIVLKLAEFVEVLQSEMTDSGILLGLDAERV
jgi:hypothetical protein